MGKHVSTGWVKGRPAREQLGSDLLETPARPGKTPSQGSPRETRTPEHLDSTSGP